MRRQLEVLKYMSKQSTWRLYHRSHVKIVWFQVGSREVSLKTGTEAFFISQC